MHVIHPHLQLRVEHLNWLQGYSGPILSDHLIRLIKIFTVEPGRQVAVKSNCRFEGYNRGHRRWRYEKERAGRNGLSL